MSKYDPAYYRAYYEKNKKDISARKKLKAKTGLKKKRATRRAWWANMPAEQKAIELQKRRDYAKKKRNEDPEAARARDRKNDQAQKERDLKRYLSKKKWERDNPGRWAKYYEENKPAILAKQKIYKESIKGGA